MLANKADLKIGSYHFMVDSSETRGYQYIPESLYSETQDVQGAEEDIKTANPYVLVWTIDDFSGGGEQKFYNSELPNSYWTGEVNPRIAGQLRPPPDAAAVAKSQTATLTTSHEVFFVGVAGKLWMGCGRDVWYSTDNGVTFSQHNTTALFGAGYTINGMTDDGNYVWVTASDGTTRKMTRIDSTTGSTTAVSDVTTAIRATGLGRIEGKVYAWTGGHLYEYDSQTTLPITHRSAPSGPIPSNIVHQPHAATPAGTYGTDFYSGICSTDTSVVYFLAASGRTLVYEFKYNAATNTFAGRKIWEPPSGFTATHIASSMGVIYLLGTYGADVALLSMSLANRDPQILTYVGLAYGSEIGGTLTTRFLCGSYGSSVMLGVNDGSKNYLYIYDAETDALTMLDRQTTSNKAYAGITSANKRVWALHPGSGTTLTVNTCNDDNAATTQGMWDWISPAHSFNYPYDEKILMGIQVVQDPAQTGGIIQVEVQLDENGTWLTTDADGADMTTAAGVKYTNFELSDEDTVRKFYYLRLRVSGITLSNARLFNITPRAYVNSFQEKWVLRLRLDDETASLYNRGSNRQVDAQTLASYIRTMVSTKSPVEFRDGWRYRKASDTVNVGYSKHVVVLEFPPGAGIILERVPGTDQVRGYCDVVLRSIQPI